MCSEVKHSNKEPEEINEEIDPRIFGTLFHETVEEIYKDLLLKEVQKTDVENILKHKEIINTALSKQRKTKLKLPKTPLPIC